MAKISEDDLEKACLEWLEELGWSVEYGPDLAPKAENQEREDYMQVFLRGRLASALAKINPGIMEQGIDDAVGKILNVDNPQLTTNNRSFHRLLTDGVDVETIDQDGSDDIVHKKAWLLDVENPDNNDWMVLNQYTVLDDGRNRRADIVLFVNGIPLVVLELKSPTDENADIRQAFNQLQTYKQDIPPLFRSNALLVISDGVQARCGTITSGWDRFMPWRTIDGETIAPKGNPELEVTIRGLFNRQVFLDYILNFITFEDDGVNILKKAAAYHQYWAVNKALDCTLMACGVNIDPSVPPEGVSDILQVEEPAEPYGVDASPSIGKRIGVVWHTQGSGKSLSMLFYAGKVIRHPAMYNPTLLVITDRNDLDDQLFGTFAGCAEMLRQSPVQAESRKHLRELLHVASGGVVFTTIQKFMPDQRGAVHAMLSERTNIVVIADEAHRSQYDFIDGFARHLHDALPNAAFIGFTATPIERDDRSTREIFGDYIDTYDIVRAVEDGATVPIYYESRLARIELSEEEIPHIDPEFEEITEGEEEDEKQRLRNRWTALEAMVGTEKRIAQVAADLVEHFELRLTVIDGKGMIVCMSRRIAVEMYEAICKLRPDWHSEDDDAGTIKIVMSGSASDHVDWQPHIRNKARREALAKRFKDPVDKMKLVIVRDMWLTGFDCPAMHTMYLDKPMGGHNLMQAIARVNRVFRDKPGGLVVDYLGIADSLKRAVANSISGGRKEADKVDPEQALSVFIEKYEIVRDMLHGFDYQAVIKGPTSKRLEGLVLAMEHVLNIPDGKKRYLPAVSALSKAFALAMTQPEALKLRDEVGFFQELRAVLVKATGDEHGKTPAEMDAAIKQLVSDAVAPAGVVDILAAAGVDAPDISILSDEFLEEIQSLPQKNLALELLKKLIDDGIKQHTRKNIVQARSFAEMLERAIRKYQNRSIEAVEVIQELIQLAKEIREARERGEDLGLNEDQMAFFDALADNESAKQVMGDKKLKMLATLLVEKVRQNVSIDWTIREDVRAGIRLSVKYLLREHGYPPDMEEKATDLVLEQAEVLSREWSIS